MRYILEYEMFELLMATALTFGVPLVLGFLVSFGWNLVKIHLLDRELRSRPRGEDNLFIHYKSGGNIYNL